MEPLKAAAAECSGFRACTPQAPLHTLLTRKPACKNTNSGPGGGAAQAPLHARTHARTHIHTHKDAHTSVPRGPHIVHAHTHMQAHKDAHTSVPCGSHIVHARTHMQAHKDAHTSGSRGSHIVHAARSGGSTASDTSSMYGSCASALPSMLPNAPDAANSAVPPPAVWPEGSSSGRQRRKSATQRCGSTNGDQPCKRGKGRREAEARAVQCCSDTGGGRGGNRASDCW